MRQLSSYLVTARARYTDPIGFVKTDYIKNSPPEPVYRAFDQIAVVATSEAEARLRYFEEHVPAGSYQTDILTIQRLGPYSFEQHKELRRGVATTA